MWTLSLRKEDHLDRATARFHDLQQLIAWLVAGHLQLGSFLARCASHLDQEVDFHHSSAEVDTAHTGLYQGVQSLSGGVHVSPPGRRKPTGRRYHAQAMPPQGRSTVVAHAWRTELWR